MNMINSLPQTLFWGLVFYTVLLIITSIMLLIKWRKVDQKSKQRQAHRKIDSEFFKELGFELRTPLSSIVGPLADLETADNLNDSQRKAIVRIDKGSKKLEALAEKISLLCNEYEGRKTELSQNTSPVLLNSLIKRIYGFNEQKAKIKNLDYSLEFLVYENYLLDLDESKFSKILFVLIDNAIKQSYDKGKVSVIVDEQVSQNMMRIMVKDEGEGMEESELAELFSPTKPENETSEYESYSIHDKDTFLNHIFNLALEMGGKLQSKSKHGKGSTFIFEFPKVLSISSDALPNESVEVETQGTIDEMEFALNPEPKHKRPSGYKTSRVLVVEDQLEMLEYIESVLDKSFNVSTAMNGREALEELKKENGNFDLVLSDVMMPEMDGYELLDNIQKSEEFASIPVALLTSRAEVDDKLQALSVGVNDYITKPFTEDILLAHCNSLLNNIQNRNEPIDGDTNSAESLDEDGNLMKVRPVDLRWLEQLEATWTKYLGDRNFNILILADEMAISERQLRRKLKKITGLSPVHYFNEIKLKKARDLLQSGEYYTVADVCYEIGFETPKYFSNLFKSRYGQAPSEYLA
ncbi:MAG: response regulator [Reichenbachiella sp.]|uniref:hybrid sensor histidine kinase/response regulator transcription factor n=1 Tax=Reichenbachiella sp. TaxID=2184521 RepID=UPI0032648A53